MSATKPVECFHKITQFQAHRGCNLFASICEKQCQQIHKTNRLGDKEQILVISLQMLQEQFKRITDTLNQQRNKYSNNLTNLYASVLKQVEKHMQRNLKEMQIQIQAEMMKKLTIQKSLIEKLQNKRFERIKCHQLISLIEQNQIQQKLKKCALIEIYQKYKYQTSKFRDSLFQGRPIPVISDNPIKQIQKTLASTEQKPSQPQKVKLPNNNLVNRLPQSAENKYFKMYQQKNRQLKKIEQFNQKLKYDMKVLATEKFNLQRQLSILNSNKMKRKLIQKTWNIAQVITKKIKKVRKQNHQVETQNINKKNDTLIIQEEVSQQKSKLYSQQIHIEPPVEEKKLNTSQIKQNDLKQSNNVVRKRPQVNCQMQDEQSQNFIDFLKNRKIN